MKDNALDFEIVFYEGILKHSPDYADAMIPLAEAYTRKGFYKKGLELDLRLSKLRGQDPVVHYNLACSFALLGQNKEALEALNHAVKLGYSDFEHLAQDKDLKGLKGLPEFESLLQSLARRP